MLGGTSANGGPYASPRALLANFCLASICFSTNHACVTALISAASTVESSLHAGLVNGTLYTTYTLSSLLLANFALARAGSKWAIFFGLVFYCGYSASFLVSRYTEGNTKIALAVAASAISGVGGGVLWTAQASFFNATAVRYSALTEIPFERATALMTAIFAGFYLGCEVALKLSLSVPGVMAEVKALLAAFTVLSAAGAAGMLCVWSVDIPDADASWIGGDGDATAAAVCVAVEAAPRLRRREAVCNRVKAAARIAATDPKIALMAPYTFAFTFALVFADQYANAHFLRPDQVGLLSAMTVGAACAASLLFGALTERTPLPKAAPMLCGSVCFVLIAVALLVESDAAIAARQPLLIALYLGFGVGRGVWESTMKAVWADFFGGGDAGLGDEDRNAAFSHIPVQNGVAGAAGFFVFAATKDPRAFAPQVLMGLAVAGAVFYLTADAVHRRHHRGRRRRRLQGRMQDADNAAARPLLSPPGEDTASASFLDN